MGMASTKHTSKSWNPICAALDLPSSEEAIQTARKLSGHVGLVKIGLELFCAAGPEVVRSIRSQGLEVFLDLKFCDIPNTVGRAVSQVADLGASIVDVHVLGGVAMMQAAHEAAQRAEERTGRRLRVIGVTVLTSLDDQALNDELGIAGTSLNSVVRLASLARSAGLDGVVCSAMEADAVRNACGNDFLIVTPGIRPAGVELNDQKRVAGPKDALQRGSNILVIGRPIVAAPDPAAAADDVLREIEEQ